MKRYFKNIGSYNLLILFAFLLFSCEDQDVEKLTGQAPGDNTIDVSDRVTGFEKEVTGAGAIVTAQGTNLQGVNFVLIDGRMAENVDATETSVSFQVPEAPAPALGMVDVVFIFSGDERAFTQIEVVANPLINRLYPFAASAGEEVVIRGGNLDVITEAGIGNIVGTIVSQTPQILVMQVPSGAPSGQPFYLISSSGSRVESEVTFVSCEDNTTDLLCATPINTNGGFEMSALGAADEIAGWGGLNGSLVTGVITDEDAYEGLQSVKILINEIGAQEYSIQPTSTMSLDPTATYHFSIWVKASGIAETFIAIDEAGSPGYGSFGQSFRGSIGSEWQEISWEFSPTSETLPGGDESVRFAISLSIEGNLGGEIYMDNLRVVEVP